MFTDLILVSGAGLMGSGVMIHARSPRPTDGEDDPPAEPMDVAAMVLRAAMGVGLALAVSFLVAEIDSPAIDVLLSILAGAVVGVIVLRVALPATRRASVGILLISLGGMLCAAWVGDAVLADSTSASPVDEAGAPSTTDPPPAVFSDTPADCACERGADLVAVGVTHDGTIYVEASDDFDPGTRIWLWFADLPMTPIQAVASPDGWVLEVPPNAPADFTDLQVLDDSGTLHLRVGFDPGPVAAMSVAGDRVPDIGYALPGGAVTQPVSTDALTRDLQASFASLPTDRWQLALTLLAVANTNGTFTYELGHASEPEAVHTRRIVVDQNTVAIHDDDGATRGGASQYLDRDGSAPTTSCIWTEAGMVECRASDARSAASQLRLLLADPTSVEAVVVENRLVGDESARCVVVSASTTGGPHVGEYCTSPTGLLVFVDDRADDAVSVLIQHVSTVDQADLVIPETG